MRIFYHCLETTVNPPPPVLEACSGENYTLSCTENATSYIFWNWNDITMRDYTVGQGISYSINTTDPLLSSKNMMVSTRLISIDSSHVHSQLEFTLFENVTSVQVWCNRVMLLVKVKGKIDMYNFKVLLEAIYYNFSQKFFTCCVLYNKLKFHTYKR